MGKSALLALGGGGLSGAAVLAALVGSPIGIIAVYLAALPLLMAGLALGMSGFGLAAAAGLALATVFGGFAAAGLYAGMHVIPSWLIVQQSLRTTGAAAGQWRPIGHVLATLTLLMAFVVAATSLAGGAGGASAGVEESVRALLATATEMIAGLDEETRTALIDQVAPLFPGFSAVFWLLTIVANAALAQAVLVARSWNLRPKPRWSAVRLPGWFDWPLVVSAVIGLIGSGDIAYVARNVSVILLTPYFLVGLAVVHCFARQARSRTLLLMAFYSLLMFFFVFAAMVVAALGIAEQWVGIRRRLGPSPPAAND